MPSRGGSATAYGILYQVLGTIGHAVTLTLRTTKNLSDATLIIEPAESGGDLQLVVDGRRAVEQWKARSTQKPWSRREIIEKVLPDLYRATSLDADSYRFITEGGVGDWAREFQFFREPTLPAEGESQEPLPLAVQSLFNEVVETIRLGWKGDPEPLSETRRRVWRMLSRFSIEPGLPQEELTGLIERQLSPLVDGKDIVRRKVRELTGHVLELAARGDTHVSAESLLRVANITPDSFLAWDALREKLRNRLPDRLRSSRYDHEHDVRAIVPEVPTNAIVAFTGESGQGKTWALAAFALRNSTGPSLVVWVPAERGPHSADQIASNELWQEGLGKSGALSLERLAQKKKEDNPHTPTPWALVCVDGIVSRADAEYLAAIPWERWGLRLALTAPEDVAEDIKRQYPGRVGCHRLQDFSHLELRQYLQRHGKSWADLPPDMRGLSRKPILAKIYADIAFAPASVPRSEYELMESYWHRIREKGERLDYGFMRSLASAFLKEERPQYPWPPELLNALNITGDALRRLKASGWIREVGEGYVECWHDRLLCWAIAETIADHVRRGIWDHRTAGRYLASCWTRRDEWHHRLGYVPMDALWLLTDPTSQAGRGRAWEVIAALEGETAYKVANESLYEHLLPTLGARIAQASVDRLENLSEEGTPHVRLVAATLGALTKDEPGVIRSLLRSSLESNSTTLQQLALRVLPRLPDPDCLDRVWQLHVPLLEETAAGPRPHGYELSLAAMVSCVSLNPQWIAHRIVSEEVSEDSLVELTFILARCRGPGCASVWHEVKATLLGRIPEARRRGVASCILRYRDRDELDQLVSWAHSQQEWVGPWSLVVLSLFDPGRVLHLIPGLPAAHVATFWNLLGPVLMALKPDETREVLGGVAAKRPEHAAEYRHLLDSDGSDEANVKAVIEELDSELSLYLQAPEGHTGLFRALSELQNLKGQAVLRTLRNKRGSSFEARLREATLGWVENDTGWRDPEFDAALHTLLRIGGSAFADVVNALLHAHSDLSILEGCKYATIRADAATRGRLIDLANGERMLGKPPDDHPVIQRHAIEALAALDEHSEFVKAVLRWGTRISPDVIELRRGRPPLGTEVALALSVLEEPDNELYPNAVLAIGLSGRMDLLPRIEAAFLGSATDSLLACSAMLALEALGVCRSHLGSRLTRQYRSGHYKEIAMRLMALVETRVELLAAALPSTGPFDDADLRVIGFLGARPEGRHLIQRQLHELRHSREWARVRFSIDTTMLLDPKESRDELELWEIADRPSGSVGWSSSKSRAIRRLAVLDSEAAFELAEESLRAGDQDVSGLQAVLLDLNADRAVAVIVDWAVDKHSAKAARLATQIIRGRVSARALSFELERRLQCHQPGVRRTAASMCGYLGPGFLSDELKNMVLTDDEIEVCIEAARSVRRQQREAEARSLIQDFASSAGAESWALADDICHLVDPVVLAGARDPLGFVSILSTKPLILRRYVSRLLEERQAAIERDLESFTRRWKVL